VDGDILRTVFAIAIFLPILVLYVWSIVWAFNDAEKRGKSGCLVVLMVMLLTWPVGLLVWIVFRPDDQYPE
jgi:hypothetical protein